jgi:hypothetical protein
VKPFELVHEYVPTPPPVRFKVFPAQIGELLLAVAVGVGFTVTATEAVLVQPLALVTVMV